MSENNQDLFNQMERIVFNNTINFEALLDVLIRSNVIQQETFKETKKAIEKRVLEAQQNGAEDQEG